MYLYTHTHTHTHTYTPTHPPTPTHAHTHTRTHTHTHTHTHAYATLLREYGAVALRSSSKSALPHRPSKKRPIENLPLPSILSSVCTKMRESVDLATPADVGANCTMSVKGVFVCKSTGSCIPSGRVAAKLSSLLPLMSNVCKCGQSCWCTMNIYVVCVCV